MKEGVVVSGKAAGARNKRAANTVIHVPLSMPIAWGNSKSIPVIIRTGQVLIESLVASVCLSVYQSVCLLAFFHHTVFIFLFHNIFQSFSQSVSQLIYHGTSLSIDHHSFFTSISISSSVYLFRLCVLVLTVSAGLSFTFSEHMILLTAPDVKSYFPFISTLHCCVLCIVVF